ARFVVHSGGASIYFTGSGLVVSGGAGSGERGAELPAARSSHAQVGARDSRPPEKPDPRPTTPIRIEFIGANPSASVLGGAPLPGKVNYFRGNDSAKWLTGLPTYGTISYSDPYPGIALSYSGRAGQLKGTYTL